MAQRPPAPPLVTVLVVLFYIGGGVVLLSGLLGLLRSVPQGLIGAVVGLLYVGLARALQLGLGWSRVVAIVLCGLGLALAAVQVVARGPQYGVATAVWPVVYLVLLTRPSVRAWYSARPPDGAA